MQYLTKHWKDFDKLLGSFCWFGAGHIRSSFLIKLFVIIMKNQISLVQTSPHRSAIDQCYLWLSSVHPIKYLGATWRQAEDRLLLHIAISRLYLETIKSDITGMANVSGVDSIGRFERKKKFVWTFLLTKTDTKSSLNIGLPSWITLYHLDCWKLLYINVK